MPEISEDAAAAVAAVESLDTDASPVAAEPPTAAEPPPSADTQPTPPTPPDVRPPDARPLPADTRPLYGCIIPVEDRARFDEVARGSGCVNPSAVEASEAILVRDDVGHVHLIGYVGMRHIVGPYVVDLHDASPEAVAVYADTVARYLRDIVRDTYAESTRSSAEPGPDPQRLPSDPQESRPLQPFGLSYDMYVAESDPPPDSAEFELLPVRVWRRRVC